jgi:uncharacterized protein (DUF1778 family)
MSPTSTCSRRAARRGARKFTRRKQDILCDRTLFVLGHRRYAAFLGILDDPPPPPDTLRKLLRGEVLSPI